MTVIIDGTTGISPVTASGTSASVDGMTVGRGGGEVSTNTAVGASALGVNSTGSYNSSYGNFSLFYNTASYNTALGANAMVGATGTSTGGFNTAVGSYSLTANTTGANNTAVGLQALQANTTASNNTAVGYQSLYAQTGSAGPNDAFGKQSGYSTTQGYYNASFGNASLYSTTTGYQNTAIGQFALYSNTTASNNTAVGFQAGYSNTTGTGITSLGYQAGYTNGTGNYSTYIGGYAGNVATANGNTCVGYQSGLALSTGTSNTYIGTGSGYLMTTGAKNTIIGGYSGNQGGLDIRTASNYIVLSDGDGNPRAYINQAGFAKFSPTGSVQTQTGSEHEFVCNQQDIVIEFTNQLTSGTPYGQRTRFNGVSPNNTTSYFFNAVDSTTSCYTIWSNGTTSGRSDARLKKNISDATPKLDDICRLQVRNYEWETSNDGSKEIGLIAQEVETVFPNLVVTHDVEKDGDDYKEIKYSVFVPMLLKAVQELKTIVDTQAAEIAKLKAK
jgi:hypothetical protein